MNPLCDDKGKTRWLIVLFFTFDFSLFIFNFADAYITVGAIIFIFSELILLKSKNES